MRRVYVWVLLQDLAKPAGDAATKDMEVTPNGDMFGIIN